MKQIVDFWIAPGRALGRQSGSQHPKIGSRTHKRGGNPWPPKAVPGFGACPPLGLQRPGLAWHGEAFLAWPGLAFSLKNHTILKRELCFQKMAFATLAGFLEPGASRKGGISWPGLGWFSSLAWPGLLLPLLASAWPPFDLPWPPKGKTHMTI